MHPPGKCDRGPYDRSFDVAYTTVHTGPVHGGTALNIVPHACTFDFEFRCLPGDDPDVLMREFVNYLRGTLEPEMKAVDAACGFEVQPLSHIGAMDTRLADSRHGTSCGRQ